ncbi:MAG TPA: hypothetical protein VFY29_07190 [Terriglobia bacterium]|nr:hypothetical protein [Terriglobia bacterium]
MSASPGRRITAADVAQVIETAAKRLAADGHMDVEEARAVLLSGMVEGLQGFAPADAEKLMRHICGITDGPPE